MSLGNYFLGSQHPTHWLRMGNLCFLSCVVKILTFTQKSEPTVVLIAKIVLEGFFYSLLKRLFKI